MDDTNTAANDAFDTRLGAAIEAARIAGVESTPELDALFTERSEIIARQQAANLAAEAHWMEHGEWPSTDTEDDTRLVKLSGLSDAQVYRLEDCFGLFEALGSDHWRSGRTFVETTARVADALLDSVASLTSDDIAEYHAATSDAAVDMAKRSALVSREALCARLAKAIGSKSEAKHRKAQKRFSRMDSLGLARHN